MIDGLVGVFVMVGVTTFMAALVELGSFVLAPPTSLEGSRQLIEQTPELQAAVSRFSAATGQPAAAVKVELAHACVSCLVMHQGSITLAVDEKIGAQA